MESAHQAAEDQSTLWNGVAGNAWVDAQAVLDRMFEPFEHMLVDAVVAAGPRQVLDVGCGTGGVTLAVARALGAGGCAVGVDISEAMIAAAKARAKRDGATASFVRADAATHAFEPARFDMIVSRFGVMFFDDPVGAFVNLRRAAHGGAPLNCLVWRDISENPFMTTAERAAAPLLPGLRPRDPHAPGQFAFADKNKVRRILEGSGWAGIEIAGADAECAFPEAELTRFVSRLGPVGRILHEADAATRANVIDAMRAACAPYLHKDEVRFTAACWMVAAVAA